MTYHEALGLKQRKTEEEQIQCALVEHLKLYGDKRVVWFAVPNGEHRSKATGGRLKAMGVVAGVYDMVFFLPDGHAAVLELKSQDGRVSRAQEAFGERCEAINVMQAVAWNIDQALAILTAWGVFDGG
jgi:hypothetical protein